MAGMTAAAGELHCSHDAKFASSSHILMRGSSGYIMVFPIICRLWESAARWATAEIDYCLGFTGAMAVWASSSAK